MTITVIFDKVHPCSAQKSSLANDEGAFDPDDVKSDQDDWGLDPSHHFHTVKEINWLIGNYGFVVFLFGIFANENIQS